MTPAGHRNNNSNLKEQNLPTMKKSYQLYLAILLWGLALSCTFAQVPDDINGRLYRLAKVWGVAKYFHPESCITDPNTIIEEAIDSVLASSTNQSFNSAVMQMLQKLGDVPTSVEPLVINSQLNKNAHFEWKEDPFFSAEVHDFLDDILDNFRPHPSCLVINNTHTDPDYAGYLSFAYDNLNAIPNFSYSKESHRLLALFYYWNVIQYYNANNALMDQPWDTTLYKFIPAMREAKNDTAFHLQFLRMVRHIDDSHGFTFSPLIRSLIGSHFPLVGLNYIEDQTVVTKIDENITALSLGDIITKINGSEIQFIRDSLRQYFAASNESTLQRDVHEVLLSIGRQDSVEIEYEDAHGTTRTTTLVKDADRNGFYQWLFTDTSTMWKITDCGYGYINMGKLTQPLTAIVIDNLAKTPAIIFDIRNYPNGTLWYLIPKLFSNPRTWALLPDPDLTYPGWYNWYDNRLDAGIFFNPKPYEGKVIILANEQTQSQAEYTVMGLQTHENALTIGSQTAGADGNISNIVLPGGLYTYWSSLGVFYPDTTDTQRVGIKIDSVVKPTIEDIRQGRDRVLMAALDCLTSTEDELSQEETIHVYPNPATDILKIVFDDTNQHSLHIKILNSIGQLVFSRDGNSKNQFEINVSDWANGVYFIDVRVDNVEKATLKFVKQ